MSEMVERVARAIMEDCGGGRDRPDFNWRYYETAARAAIEAMREPTEAMIEAHARLCVKDGCIDGPDPSEAFNGMIDAALK